VDDVFTFYVNINNDIILMLKSNILGKPTGCWTREASSSVHRFSSQSGEHEMLFSSAHMEDLVRRLLLPGEMTETFNGRGDRLFYRHVVLEDQQPKVYIYIYIHMYICIYINV